MRLGSIYVHIYMRSNSLRILYIYVILKIVFHKIVDLNVMFVLKFSKY